MRPGSNYPKKGKGLQTECNLALYARRYDLQKEAGINLIAQRYRHYKSAGEADMTAATAYILGKYNHFILNAYSTSLQYYLTALENHRIAGDDIGRISDLSAIAKDMHYDMEKTYLNTYRASIYENLGQKSLAEQYYRNAISSSSVLTTNYDIFMQR